MATDGKGGGSGSTYPMRMILTTPTASAKARSEAFSQGRAPSMKEVLLATPRASDMKAGGHGDTGRTGTVRHMLATPRKTDADRGFRGDVRMQLEGKPSRHAGMLGTPTANPAPRGTVLRNVKGDHRHREDRNDRLPNPGEMVHYMLPTPVAQTQQGGMRWEGGARARKMLTESGLMDVMSGNPLPTPTKRDKRMDAWSPAYDRRKSPGMDAVMDGAMTGKASDKWAYARTIASILTEHGLTGASMTLPVVYGWMMGYPPQWLELALLSALRKERLRQV